MAVTQKQDGRWAVYYRADGKVKWEYFGRGPEAAQAARARNDEIAGIRKGNPPRRESPPFEEIANAYL